MTDNDQPSPQPTAAEMDRLGMDTEISRRDFIGGTVIGAGAALLTMAAPGAIRQAAAQTTRAPMTGLGADWSGPGGVGDYASSNGNTAEIVNAAHDAIRNQSFDKALAAAKDTGEAYDLIVVGCGQAGLSAAYAYHKERPNDTILLLDQHAVFGGEARQNEFDVDGYHLTAPQGATSLIGPMAIAKTYGYEQPLWSELGFPDEMPLQKPEGLSKDILIPEDCWAPMHYGWWRSDTGFFYGDKGWVKNPWRNGFDEAPLPEESKRALTRLELYRTPPQRPDWESWLDSMTYEQFLQNVVGITGTALKDVMDYLRPISAAAGLGLGGDVISAYQAFQFFQPGVSGYARYQNGGRNITDEVYFPSYPGGHSLIARMYVKKIIPDAFKGDYTIANLLNEHIQWQNLDRPGASVRLRLSSTVIAVAHEGPRDSAKTVAVHYVHGGRVYKAQGKRTIVAGQQHVNRHICRDVAPEVKAAMGEFHHAPMLNVNVAVTNWRFLENLGIASARWFEGLGWWLSLRRQILTEGVKTQPLDPSKPTVLTLYIPFTIPGMPIREQCTAARMNLFGMSFAQIEFEVRAQFTRMFASAGFDAKRDIAGIVANRFGHAYVATPPNFYFGKGGGPATKEILRQRHNRMAFAHSELCGYQMWETAAAEGVRAATQVLEIA